MSDTPSLTGARWVVLPVDDAPLQTVRTHAPDLPEAAARVMAIRGFDPRDGWLTPSADHLHDPHRMANMDVAVDRLQRAIHDSDKVRVITDYDVDGTTSSLILQAAMQLAGSKVPLDYHIPDRFTEGYGFSVQAAEKAAADGVDLIVTADIGVRDHAAVAAARAAGIDVVVCDHHLPPGADVPPDATVLCPPQAACDYPNPHLAACGVATKLAEALLHDHSRRDAVLPSLHKLAAMGTVADLVRLDTLENRAIVASGLHALNHGRHNPGLAALLAVADARPGEIDEQTLGWKIAPRINAAGRLTNATHVVELLTCRDPARARTLARALDAINDERREVQERLVDTVLAGLPETPDPFVLAAGPEPEGWHRGVVGIVAARVKDSVRRPTAIVSVQGDWARGSVRSTRAIHAVRALDSAADLLEKYGGHPAAAGFTVRTEHLDALRERLCAYAEEHADDADVDEVHEIDAVVAPHDLTDALQQALRRLGPFGQGHPAPRLMVRDASLTGLRTMSDGKHLKGRIAGTSVDALWWQHGALADTVRDRPLDLVGQLGVNVWKGRRSLQFVVSDAR